jgi:multidrug resistance efflux pump
MGLLLLALSAPVAVADEAAPKAIGAIGHIVPGSGVIAIVGTPGARVTKVPVRAGQSVKAGTVLMVTQGVTLDSDPALATAQLKAARDLATQQVDAQTAMVRLADARNDHAAAALKAYQSLGASLTSTKEMQRLSDAAKEARLSLDVERTKLQVIKTQSQSALQTAIRQADLALHGAQLTAPFDGTVLKINRQSGEQLTSDPAIEFADLRSMVVVCQVFEGDLLALHPGMMATVKAQPLGAPLHGRIEEVGRTVDGRTRLGEVRIRLDKADPASRLVGLEVEVAIAR